MFPETPFPLKVPPAGAPVKVTGVLWFAQNGPPGGENATPGNGFTLTPVEAQTVVLHVPIALT